MLVLMTFGGPYISGPEVKLNIESKFVPELRWALTSREGLQFWALVYTVSDEVLSACTVTDYRYKLMKKCRSESLFYMSCIMRKTDFCICKKTEAQISCAVTAQLISTFVFTIRIVQSLF